METEKEQTLELEKKFGIAWLIPLLIGMCLLALPALLHKVIISLKKLLKILKNKTKIELFTFLIISFVFYKIEPLKRKFKTLWLVIYCTIIVIFCSLAYYIFSFFKKIKK